MSWVGDGKVGGAGVDVGMAHLSCWLLSWEGGSRGQERPSGLSLCDSGQGRKSRGRRKKKGGRRGLCPRIARHVVTVLGGGLALPKLES